MAFHVPEKYRLKTGVMQSTAANGNNGVFIIDSLKLKKPLRTQASDGMDWQHVSVSVAGRCPTWLEMCFVKSLFWDAEDCVMQLHVPESEWISCHPYTLHLWRPIGVDIPRPLQIMV